MIDRPVTLPTPLNTLVTKSLELCELMLPVCDVFYPFAAIYENGRVGCIFADETGNCNGALLILPLIQKVTVCWYTLQQ